MTDTTLAQLSNFAIYSAMVVLTLAMVAYAVHLARLVPAAPRPDARMMSVNDPGDTYEIDIIDPFSLLEEE